MREGGLELSIRDWKHKDEKVKTKPCGVERLSERVLRFELREGKNRQIRKMLGSAGHAVKHLHRIAFGPIELGDLKLNEMELLTDQQVEALLKHV
jgi:16S rRNA U516 pseudouridylate synthase RsuA-like enzyme